MARSQLDNTDSPSNVGSLSNPTRGTSGLRALLPYAVLLGACYFLGLYCCELNNQLYKHHSPFYDSLSYNEKLFRVMTISRQDGLVESMETACFAGNTNCLPFLVAAAIAPAVEPSRMVGVWIQTGLLFLFLASLFYYLSSIRGLSTSPSLAGCLIFLAAKCLYFENGGLSDFRMDLSLFLSFGLTAIWYLSSMSRPSDRNFILLGIAGAICCLCRATAPIYIVFSLIPLFLGELLKSQHRLDKLRGIAISATIVVVLAGWFYILNFEYLRFYYVDWNTDANAKIPLTEALHHWKLAQRSVGEPIFLLLICWWCGVAMGTRKQQSLTSWIAGALRNQDIDWRIGWLGIAAVVMMVARQAGLNPFVCMPAVFGLILFFTLPCLKRLDALQDDWLTFFCWVLLLICIGISCVRGWKRHSPDEFNTMQASQKIIDTMVENTKLRNKTELRYGVVQITNIDSNILYSGLIYDRPDGEPHLGGVVIDGINVRRIQTFARPAKADWEMLAGSTDEEKIAGMVTEAGTQIDFLVIPDGQSAKAIATKYGHNAINNHLVRIRELIINDDRWGLVKSGIQVDEKEIVEIYRNLDRDHE